MEQEFRFDDNHHNEKENGGIMKFIWNSETKEFCGRDGGSWAKVSLFYAVFYFCLGSFFVGMLAVFMRVMPRDVPTYYGTSSTMNARGVNPGLGFRPQIDVEDHLIRFDPTVNDNLNLGKKQYVDNIKYFLAAKYPAYEDQSNIIDCEDGKTYDSELTSGKVCRLNYEEALKSTDCTAEKNYGFDTERPCILIKLNKIVSWTPADSSNVTIQCQGETSVDKDNLKAVEFYSIGDKESFKTGVLERKYFPYFNQNNYRAPFVFARFDIPSNTLVNIECKAYAPNIDNADRLNRRGQTKFSLYVNRK